MATQRQWCLDAAVSSMLASVVWGDEVSGPHATSTNILSTMVPFSKSPAIPSRILASGSRPARLENGIAALCARTKTAGRVRRVDRRIFLSHFWTSNSSYGVLESFRKIST